MKICEYYKNFSLNASKNDVNMLIEHSTQVEKLAKQLLNLLVSNHLLNKLYKNYENLLSYAALVHDIGIFLDTDEKHNKIGAQLVLKNKIDGLTDCENNIVSCLVRYHRGKSPKENHKTYMDLDEKSKNLVRIYAGILRLADALDCNHFSTVEKIELEFDNDSNTIFITTMPDISTSLNFDEIFRKKKKLLKKTLNKKIKMANGGLSSAIS